MEMIRASKLGGIVPGVLISDEAISAIFTKKTLLGHVNASTGDITSCLYTYGLRSRQTSRTGGYHTKTI